MKNFPLITKYINEIGIDVDQSEFLFLRFLEVNLKNVENGTYTVDDAVGEAFDDYDQAMGNSF